VEEMYRTLFAHPLVQAITSWDYKDGAWLNAPSGFLRLDNTTKPAYHKLHQLIKEDWWTDTTIHTDENGYAQVDAFKGSYLLDCGQASGKISLTQAGDWEVSLQ